MNKKLLLGIGGVAVIALGAAVICSKNMTNFVTKGENETCTAVFNKEVNAYTLDGLKAYYSWDAMTAHETTFSVELYTNQADQFSCGGDNFFSCKNYSFDAYAEGAKFYFNCRGVKSLVINADFAGIAFGGINSNMDEIACGVTETNSQTVYLESDNESPLLSAYIMLPKTPDGEYTINSIVLEYDVSECREINI